MMRYFIHITIAALFTAHLTACVTTPTPEELALALPPPNPDGTVQLDDLVLVDCQLPGQVRQLGQYMTYIAPRRWTKTTRTDCGIRGGEFILFDRADYSQALQVLLPKARTGDALAQYYVGEIYEKGLGLPAPNYVEAAVWYRQSAQSGYQAAQTNLGMLYERGLGVPQDRGAALQWYRKATGLDADGLVFESQLQAERAAFTREIAVRNQVVSTLQRQLQRTQTAAAASPPPVQRRTAPPAAPSRSRPTARPPRVPAAPAPVTAPPRATAPQAQVTPPAPPPSPVNKPKKATVKLTGPSPRELARATESLQRDAAAQVEQVKRTIHAIHTLRNAESTSDKRTGQVSGKKAMLMGKLELSLRQRSDALVDNQRRLETANSATL